MLALFSSNPALIANLFYLLTFPLAAASAFLVMRKLDIAAAPAAVAAVLFALLPYHFYRNESQLTLSAYYSVPLSAYLFLSTFLGEARFTRRASPASGVLGWLSWRTARTVLLCVVIASSGLYYAAFALVLLSAGALVALIARMGRAAVTSALGCVLLIGVVLVANLSPSLVYRAEHGANRSIARSLTDTELLGLKPAQLLLPVQGHRLPPLSKLNGEYAKAGSLELLRAVLRDARQRRRRGVPVAARGRARCAARRWRPAGGFAAVPAGGARRAAVAADRVRRRVLLAAGVLPHARRAGLEPHVAVHRVLLAARGRDA